MHGHSDDKPPAPATDADDPSVTAQAQLPHTARSATARGGSGGFAADRIGHAHQWLVRADPPSPPPTSAPAAPAPTPRIAATTPNTPQWPPRRREPSSSFYVTGESARSEESSPFAGYAIDRASRPGQPVTNPGYGHRPAQTTPATGYRTPVSDGMVSSALAGLPIQRPRVHSAHGSGATPVVGPNSHAGADPSAAVLALPDIPTYATPVHGSDVDAQLAFEALFQVALGSRDSAHLAARMWRQTVAAGRPLFAAGEAADCAYVVATGLGRVEVQGPVGMAALTPLRTGDLVGLAALAGDACHDDAAVAASDLVVFSLRREEFHKLCAEAPLLAQRLLAAGLVQASRRIRAQAERMTAYAMLDAPDAAVVAAAHPEPHGSRIGRLFAKLTGGKENG